MGLLSAFLLLVSLPARHALLEIWPGRMAELVLADGAVMIKSSSELPEGHVILSRTFPHTLLALEFYDGRRDRGFLIHEDPETKNWWFQSPEGLHEVDPEALRRYYAPNALTMVDRLRLMQQRLGERRSGALTRRVQELTGGVESAPSTESEDL